MLKLTRRTAERRGERREIAILVPAYSPLDLAAHRSSAELLSRSDTKYRETVIVYCLAFGLAVFVEVHKM